MTTSFRLLLSTTALLAGSFPVLAADYNPPIYIEQAPELVPVEIGSGWYLRGDIAYNVNKPFDDVTFGTFSEDTIPISATVGIGYNFSDFLRLETNIGFLTGHQAETSYASGASTISESTDNEVWSGIVSAYADLGTFAGFTPYVGAGVGLVNATRRYDISDSLTGTTFTDRNSEYSLAYSVGAGVAYNVTNNLSLDVGYQYFAAPNAEYVEMTGPGTYAVEEGMKFHHVKVGLRYDLW